MKRRGRNLGRADGWRLVQTWVPPALHAWLRAEQERTGLTMAGVVRLLLLAQSQRPASQ